MAEFYHLYVSPKFGVTMRQLEKKLDLAVDWFRYADGVYVLYTTSSADKWKARLVEFVKPGGELFICSLDVRHRQGWMAKEFWDWITERSKGG